MSRITLQKPNYHAKDGVAKWTCAVPGCYKELAMVVTDATGTYLELPADYEFRGQLLSTQLIQRKDLPNELLRGQVLRGLWYGPLRHDERHPKRKLVVNKAVQARLWREQGRVGTEEEDKEEEAWLGKRTLNEENLSSIPVKTQQSPRVFERAQSYMKATGKMLRVKITCEELPICVDCPNPQHGTYYIKALRGLPR